MKNESKFLSKNINKFIKKELSMKYFSNISKNKRDFDEKIKEILIEEMNKECFDCGSLNPKYISINNGIFLCNECSKIHNQFTPDISLIKPNNLFLLSNKEILYIYYGGNSRLNNFVNYEFPGLQNYQPGILYRTQALNYYRNRLNSIVHKRKRPEKPNSIYAYKLIGENNDKYSKNRQIFETNGNEGNKINQDNNNENITKNDIKKCKIETEKNLKFIYSSVNIKNSAKFKKQKISFDSIYQNNINNNLNLNFGNKVNKNIKRRKNVLDNDVIKDQHLYNSTFFEEMKNIFKDKNIKGKIRMRLKAKKDNDNEKNDYIKDDLLTHQASLSNTIYFPYNNIDAHNNANNFDNSNYLKKINLNRFTSLKNAIKAKNKNQNITINDNILKIYSKPRMSNNSFSKKYQQKSTTEESHHYNYSRKPNSIINNGLTNFSLKKINLKEDILHNINRKENGFIQKKPFLSLKSNTSGNIFNVNGNVNNRKEIRDEINYKLCNIRKNTNREFSFNNHKRKINLNLDLNEDKYNIREKSIINYSYKKRIFDKINNAYDNSNDNGFRFNKDYNNKNTKKINSNIMKNIINDNNNYNHNNKDYDSMQDKKINFIKVIKTTIGKRNNSDINWKKNNFINNKNLNTNKEQKSKKFNLNEDENINNIFLCDDDNNVKKRIIKAMKDKKEQELIEKEDFQKLLSDENSLYNNISIDILNKNEEKDKNEDIVNGGINNKNDIKHNKKDYDKNRDIYFFNKKNCTDLILISKNTNDGKCNIKEKNIPNEFMIEVQNLINKYKLMEKNNKIINETKIDIKKNKENKEIKRINNNPKTISQNNSIKSIRNKYKQKTIMNHENNNIINKKGEIDSMNNSLNNNFKEKNTVKNKSIKIINISKEYWNINQLGEIKVYEEVNDIELD